MTKKQAIQLFEEKQVRVIWDDEQEKWYFSIVDAIAILTDSVDSAAYWRKLKQRLKAEGNETVTNCHSLKMRAADGKMRKTDVARQGGEIARNARLELEAKTREKVISPLNAQQGILLNDKDPQNT